MKQFLTLFMFIMLGLLGCKNDNQSSVSKSTDSRTPATANVWFSDPEILRRTDSVIALMTLDEKIGQLVLYTSDWDVTGPVIRTNYKDKIKAGMVGALFNAFTPDYIREIQKVAVEESRLHIPLLFGYDVIHGHRTIFPLPIAEACSWDLEAMQRSARIAAIEAAAEGINWTFAPMVDIARDPRWGRVAEGAGEDTYLGSRIAEARVLGFQGDNLADTLTVLACVKHFAAYGAAQAGRDYHTVDMSERTLRGEYLPPYQAAINAGVATVMTSFNDLNGIPATANRWLLTDILRNEWGFNGMVVTDYTSVNELVSHGIAADDKEAALLSLKAGVDMDMQGSAYYDYLKTLVNEKKVTEEEITQGARRIIAQKFYLGLFDDPYRYCSEQRRQQLVYHPDHLAAAREIASKSIVLLKNDKNVLPLTYPVKKIALIGALATSQDVMLGCWRAAGDTTKAISVLQGLKEAFPTAQIEQTNGCPAVLESESGFAKAVSVAKSSDVIIMVLGEPANLSGEASSRTNINLPGSQTALLREVRKTGKPLILILLNGRPLALEEEYNLCDAMVEAWHAGTMGGHAIADIITGKSVPSAKLCMTFPRNLGQVPIFYNMKNTGRPEDPNDHYTSKYLDSPNSPLFPFGFGLSYTTFEYSEPKLSAAKITENDQLTITVEVKNTGKFDAQEVVQLYIRDDVGSVTRPVKELKGFEKQLIKAGETKNVTFTITISDLMFYRQDMTWGAEAGTFTVFVGGNSRDVKEAKFTLQM